MDDLKSKGTKAFIWDFFGKMAKQGMGFVVTIFLARLLEPSDFGLIAMVMVIVGIAEVFSDIGLGGALIQQKRVLPVHYSSVFYLNVAVGVLLALILFFSAEWVGAFYENEKLVPLAKVISLTFILNAFSSVQVTKLRKELNFALITKISFLASLISGIIGISLAFYGAGVWSLVVQIISAGLMFNIFIWYASGWKPSFLFSFKALMQLWGFGFRMFLVGVLDAVFSRLDYIVIGKLFTPTTLGFYQRAKSLSTMLIQYSSGSLMSVMFPVLSKVKNDLPRFQNIVIKLLGSINFITLLLFGGLYLVSEELIVLLFSEIWLPSVEYFKILVLSAFGFPIATLLANILKSRGNSKAFLRMVIFHKIIFSINLYVGFLWGIEGYLYGLIVVAVFNVGIAIYMASREISLSPFVFVKPLMVQVVLTVIAVFVTIFIAQSMEMTYVTSLLVKGVFFTFLYFLINWVLKTSAYLAVMEQVIPILKRKFKK
ncbi:lipopolysaccharide biosynthesis protein [Sulfurovum sp. CS9]|uniref:lipopolysaccharide biosynthesis protein n=1 Tax=Sulfurovum sp. CS9 TaxID=3391146 RepID=UPI0039EB8EF2